MKKILFTLALLGGFAVSSFAQTSNDGGKFSIGVEAGLPVGNISNAFGWVIGGSLKYEQPVASDVAVTITAGYSSFQGKTITVAPGVSGKVNAVGFIPAKAGLKFNIAEALYGEAQLGAAFNTQKGGATYFAYSPGIGYKFSDNVDLGVRYEGWSHNGTISQIAARLAYSF